MNFPFEAYLLSRILFTDIDGIPFDVGEYDNLWDLNDKLEQFSALGDYEQLCVSFLISEG